MPSLLNQRLCLRRQSLLANHLDSATPFCSLHPPQAALANVPDREAEDSADEQICTMPVVPARGGGMPPPYIEIVRSTHLLFPIHYSLFSIHYMKNGSACTRDAGDGVPYGFYR